MVERWQELAVLIVGCGSIGKRHARVLASLGVTDIRACDPIKEQRESLLAQVASVRMYDSYQAGLNVQPDTVLICTPPAMHVPMALQALNAGCHVLTEKPLADTTAGVNDLMDLVGVTGKKVMVGLCFRYHAGLVKAKHNLDSGRVGRLVSVRALMGEHFPDVRPDYRSLFSAKQGGAFDLVHDIDLAIWYAAQPVQQVYALCGSFSDIGIEATDIAEILIGFPDRCLATIHLDYFQRPRRRQIELLCTNGVIIVEFARWERCTVSVYDASRAVWEHEEIQTDRDDMFRAEDREFLQAVADELPIRCTIEEGLKSMQVVQAAVKGLARW